MALANILVQPIMSNTILVIAEQREGKLNRVSWETLAAGQALSAATGWVVEAAVLGDGICEFCRGTGGQKVSKVYGVESPKLEPYTPMLLIGAQATHHRPRRPGWS